MNGYRSLLKVVLLKVVLIIVLVILVANTGTPRLTAGCRAFHECGAWCEPFGSCSYELCRSFGSGVSCTCGGITTIETVFDCDGGIDTRYF